MRRFAAVALLLASVALIIAVSIAAVAYALPRRSFSLQGIKRITVVGNNILAASEVLKIAGFPEQPTAQPLNPSAMSDALRQNRFVKRASIMRKGDTVVVRLSEVKPYFRLVIGGERFWLCRDGEVIAMDAQADQGKLFAELRKRVTVRLASHDLLDDAGLLAHAVYVALRLEGLLPMQFSEASVSGDGDYHLQMRNGLQIKLGAKEGVEANLAVLDKAIRAARSMNKPVKMIDFRDSTHVVVTTTG